MRKAISALSVGALMLGACAASSSAAVLTVPNGNFSGGVSTGNNPASWTTVETNVGADAVYAQTAGGTVGTSNGNVLHFKDGDGLTTSTYIQQSITANNPTVTASTVGNYKLTMDMGWRNDLSDRNDAVYRLSLIDVTDNVELAFQTVTYPVRATGLSDSYSITGTNSYMLSYANTTASYAGDEIAFRIARVDAATAGGAGNFASTSFIDNVALETVPEPSSLGLLGLGAVGLLRRRRR